MEAAAASKAAAVRVLVMLVAFRVPGHQLAKEAAVAEARAAVEVVVMGAA